MAAVVRAEKSIAQGLDWAVRLLDYTDEVCASIPHTAYSLRPIDPSGAFMFSIGEIIAHVADTRWTCIDWVNGSEHEKQHGFCSEYGGISKPWCFKDAPAEQILQSLSDGRSAIDELFARPAQHLLETTDSLIAAHVGRIERARAAGKDTADLEAAGPSTLMNIVLFLVAHEQAHRGALQVLLREHGASVFRFA